MTWGGHNAYKRPDYTNVSREDLIERITQLEDSMGMDFEPDPTIIHLTSLEAKFLGALASCEVLYRERASGLFHGMRVNPADPKIYDVMVTRMRKKLVPLGVSIVTVWGRGWSMSEKDRARVRAWDVRRAKADPSDGGSANGVRSSVIARNAGL